jgi:hypothetical protein
VHVWAAQHTIRRDRLEVGREVIFESVLEFDNGRVCEVPAKVSSRISARSCAFKKYKLGKHKYSPPPFITALKSPGIAKANVHDRALSAAVCVGRVSLSPLLGLGTLSADGVAQCGPV